MRPPSRTAAPRWRPPAAAGGARSPPRAARSPASPAPATRPTAASRPRPDRPRPPVTAAPVDRRPRRRRPPAAGAGDRRRRHDGAERADDRHAAADDAPAPGGPYEPGGERHRRRHRHRDRHRHPRPGHRRLADPAGRASTSARTSTGSSSPTARRTSCSAATSRSCSATTSSTRSAAVQVCREMVEQEGAFLLVGGGGADQITACAQYADENGIPYLSAGVNEDGPRRPRHLLRHVADLRRAGPAADRPAAGAGVHRGRRSSSSDTPSFDDAHDGDQGRGRGGRPRRSPYETRINKTRRRGRAAVRRPGAEGLRRRGRHPAQLAGRLHRAGQPGPQPGLHPDLDRPGITSGLNTVTDSAARPSRPASSSRRRPASTSSTSSTPTTTPAYAAVRRRRHGRRHRARSCGR